MTQNDKPEAYLKALKSKPLRDIKIEPSSRLQALKDQKGRCAKCKHEINRAFAKFIQDPTTKKYTVLCHNCAVDSELFKKKSDSIV